MSRPLLIALGGSTSAILAVAFLTGAPMMLVMANLAPLPLFLVGLGYGAVAGTLAAAFGLFLSGAFGGVVAAGLFGLVHALPTSLAIRQSLLKHVRPDGTTDWYPVGAVLCWLTALTGALLIVAALLSYQSGSGLEAAVTAYLTQVMTVFIPAMAKAETQGAALIDALVPFFPATAAISWLAVLAGNGLFAQSILVRAGRNLRPTPKLEDFALPDWISWLLVGSAAMALVGSGEVAYLGRNLVAIMSVPFFVLGAVVVHALSKRAPAPKFLLMIFYMVVFLSAWARMAVAGVGLVEQWVGMRSRLAPPNPPQEDE